jgi:hypothetical protein
LIFAAGYALGLDNGVTETFSGTVTALCYWVRHNTVQEGANGVWTIQSGPGGTVGLNNGSGPAPQVIANFLHCSLLSAGSDRRKDPGISWVIANPVGFVECRCKDGS